MRLLALGLDPRKLIDHYGAIGLFLIVFAETGLLIGFFLPGDALLFTAGLLVATDVLHTNIVVIVWESSLPRYSAMLSVISLAKELVRSCLTNRNLGSSNPSM